MEDKEKEEKTAKKVSETPAVRFAFAIFLAILALLAWQVTRPLVSAIVWAAMLAYIVTPVFRWINEHLGGKWPSLSAFLTLCAMFIVIIIPVSMIFVSLGREVAVIGTKAAGLFSGAKLNSMADPANLLPAWLPASIAKYLRNTLSNSQTIAGLTKDLAQWAAAFFKVLSGRLLQGFASVTFLTAMTLMISFFFIRDGKSIVEYIKGSTPLSADQKDLFYSRTDAMLKSVIFGVLLTVLIQSILGGLGWWFVGLNNPAFFGMLMFLAGMLPAGTAVVWLPGAIYLFCTGDIKNGIILLVWGVGIVSTIDNFLRPLLISSQGKGESISTLLVIIGICGGLICWGFLGIFLGPLVLALFKLTFDFSRSKWMEESDK
jgi:predicted PurR-regulated permease PerM